MTQRSTRLLLQDMLDSIALAAAYLDQLGTEQFLQDEKTQDAVIRRIQIIGEAASQLDAQWRALHPAADWQQVVGMRNRLVHAYAEVDLLIVWNTVRNDLPVLDRQLREALQHEP